MGIAVVTSDLELWHTMVLVGLLLCKNGLCVNLLDSLCSGV